MATFEKCSAINGMKSKSPIVEVFSAMVQGKDVNSINNADANVARIKELAERANLKDASAIAELNEIRKFAIEPALLQEIKMLGFFGNYKPVGYGESIEVEVPQFVGEKSRPQAKNGDVVFSGIYTEKYAVPTQTIAGGYAVDYRKISMGDMALENQGMEQVKIDIRNKANKYAIDKIYNAIKNAAGVKFTAESAGLTKAIVDAVVTGVRRFGKTSLIGDYSMVSQIPTFATFTSGTTFTAIDDAAIAEIRKTGLLGDYNGSTVVEIPNSFDTTEIFDNNGTKYFKTVAPNNILFVVPTGVNSPIKTWTRGGLTSFTGNDVTTGHVLTRFDLEVAVDIAKGREYEIGVIKDTNITY